MQGQQECVDVAASLARATWTCCQLRSSDLVTAKESLAVVFSACDQLAVLHKEQRSDKHLL